MNAAFRYRGSKWRFYPFIAEYINKSPVSHRVVRGSAILLQSHAASVQMILTQTFHNFFGYPVSTTTSLLQAIASRPHVASSSRKSTKPNGSIKFLRPNRKGPGIFSCSANKDGGEESVNGRRSAQKDRRQQCTQPLWSRPMPQIVFKSAGPLRAMSSSRIVQQPGRIKDYDSPETTHYKLTHHTRRQHVPARSRIRCTRNARRHPAHRTARHTAKTARQNHCQRHGPPSLQSNAPQLAPVEIQARTASHDYVLCRSSMVSPTCIHQPSLFSLSDL